MTDCCPVCGGEWRINADLPWVDNWKLFADRGARLTVTEARVLTAIRGKNRPVSRHVLMNVLYAADPNGGPDSNRIIDVYILKIRKKIKKAGLPWRLDATWGLGWELHEEQTAPTMRNVAIGLGAALLLAQPVLSHFLD